MKRILLSLILVTLLGCTRKELYFGIIELPGKINLSADWRDTENIPGGIVVYFYPEGGSVKNDYTEPIIEYIPNRGSNISLPYGTYYGFIYNDYTEDLAFRYMDEREHAEAHLERNNEAPFSTRNPMTKHVGCVENFYNAQVRAFTISEEDPTHTITVNPKLKTLLIDLTIHLIGGKNIAYARGTLSGINKALNLYTGNPNKESLADVVFDFNITDNTLRAEIECFGVKNLNTSNNSDFTTTVRNNLELAFILNDGTQLIGEHIFDITRIIREIVPVENEGVCDDVIIELSELGIIIPDVESSDDGFDLDVGDWDDPIIEDLI